MKKPQAIIYDFDGTILDTLPWHLKAYRKTIAKFGLEASDEEIISKCFNIVNEVAAHNFGIKDVEAFSNYYHEGARLGFRKAELHKNIIETLKALTNQGYTICLGSLARQTNFELALERFKLKQYFKVILSYDDCPFEKPIIFQTLAHKAGVDPVNVLVIGDAANDIQAAKSMKCQVALYHPPEHEKFYSLDSLQAFHPDYIIKDHLEIINLLK
ncbi:MAG: HAD family hydrolase [Patescibacteria group bacterium]|jgi:phosphoglycolate phosphatase-like HAD superfamily hydrolase